MAQNKIENFKLLNWNANGVKRQENELRYFLKVHDIDVACISETHLKQGERFSIPNYLSYRSDRISLIASGGVAILINRKIKHTLIQSPSSNEIESIIIKIELVSSNITVIAAYKPPNKKFPSSFMKAVFDGRSQILLAGDLNCKNKFGTVILLHIMANSFRNLHCKEILIY